MAIQERETILDSLGFRGLNNIYYQLSVPRLYEETILREQGIVANGGPIVVKTGTFTGRTPKDKFVIDEPSSREEIWWGSVNQPLPEANFDALLDKVLDYYEGKDAFVQDVFAGQDPEFRLGIRVITEEPWHSHFARNMFIVPQDEELSSFSADYTIIQAPGFMADPEVDGTRTGTFILLNLARRIVLIGGTYYTGEIKKSVFTIMNYLLPREGVLTMHCSANQGADDDVALFFGLSGTGKTTLSSDSSRTLIGDDEHGWDHKGIFNIEGGCYAKVIRLSAEGEPEIYATTRMFGSMLENVIINEVTRVPDLDDDTITENTRVSYPIEFIPNASSTGQGGHPRNIIFLTADAFGVMPPVSKLTPAQAMYHFLSGYTAKVAGTEKGVKEPQATFSACFGAPFLPLHPNVYAKLLGEKIEKHGVNVWLVNTGWTGGPYGVGERMSLKYTRAMINAILDGSLADVETRVEPHFSLKVPLWCPDVPKEVLDPRSTWDDVDAYDAKAGELVDLFCANFELYKEEVSEDIRAAGPC